MSNFEDAEGKLVYFSGIDQARFRRPVVPGDQLRFELMLEDQTTVAKAQKMINELASAGAMI